MKKQKKRKHKSRLKKLRSLRLVHDEAWALMSRYVRLRDKCTCITCKKTFPFKKVQAGHLFHGDNMDFFYDNINCQCQRCNKWLHGNSAIYAIEVDKKWGPGTAEKLRLLRNTPRHYTRDDYQKIMADISLKLLGLANPEGNP
jgi:5-methylcytosine-specific restriction endonuclease McrA